MASFAQVKLFLEALRGPAAPLGGGNSAEVNVDQRLGDGFAANQIDLVHQSTRTLGAGANEDIDMRALLDVQGVVMSTLTEIVALVIETDSDNGDDIDVGPSAATGWFGADALFDLVGENLHLKAGGTYPLVYNPTDGAYLVSATEKSINVLNLDGASGITYTLTIFARSA